MATSQNGYAAGNRALIHNPAVPGTNIRFPGGLRKGPAGDLLLWVALQLHHRVENGGTGYGMWGYAYRAIRGATSLSNHASGTAIDWHAPRHPLGKAGTFNAAQVREIRRILAEAGGCVRWGGDYTGRKDEMHFEIVASEAACARALAAVTPGAPTATQPAAPVKPKELPTMIDRPLVKGFQEGRIICPTGTASGIVAAAWVSVTITGGGRVELWCQRGARSQAAPPGTANGTADWTIWNAERPFMAIPSGTEFIDYRITANGPGAILIEQKPK